MTRQMIHDKKFSEEYVIITISGLDEEDLASILQYIQFRDRVVLICDLDSKTDYDIALPGHVNNIRVRFSDINETIKKIDSWLLQNRATVKGIIGLDEEYHYEISYQISVHLGIEYYDKKTLALCSNKFFQRTAMKKAGINVPDFEIIQSDQKKFSIDFPNVLKITTGYASSFIYINHDNKELLDNVNNIKVLESLDENDNLILKKHQITENDKIIEIDPRYDFLLEEFIGGIEFSADYLVDKNEINILRIVKKITNNMFPSFVEAYMLFNPQESKVSGFSLEELNEVCKQSAICLGINHGVCMMDFKYYKNKIYVIETTVRPGISSFMDLIGETYGTISINYGIMQKLGIDMPKIMIPKKTGIVIFIVKDISTGKSIIRIDTNDIEKRYKNKKILINKYYKQGEVISDPPDGIIGPGRLIGHVIMIDIDPEMAETLINDIKESVKVITR